jgi:hypothetical protein
VASVIATTSRIQKNRPRKLTNSLNPLAIERAIKASQDTDTDGSSLRTRTPTVPSFAPSDRSASNEASPPSSASSTPRLPSSRSPKSSPDIQLQDAVLTARLATSSTPQVSSCCKPKATSQESERIKPQSGNCCNGNAKETPKPVQSVRSGCSHPRQPNLGSMFPQMNGQPAIGQPYTNFPHFQQHGPYNGQQYSMNPGFNYPMPGNMGIDIPLGFTTPIYNHMASGYQQSPSTPMAPAGSGTGHTGTHPSDHNCHCGDSCSCFGCAAHPHNATMTEYIRVMHQYMSTGGFGAMPPPTYDLPSYPHHPGFGAETASNLAYNMHSPTTTNFVPFGTGPMAFQANMNTTMGVPHTPLNAPNPWQQTHTPTQVHDLTSTDAYFNQANTQPEWSGQLKQEESASSPAFADSPSDGKDEDSATLSPSTYLWQEIVLPGCNDATGTCQCGEGCDCVGCLTHGGHNGVSFEVPVTTEQDAFSNFIPSNENGHGERFMIGAFSEAPT